MATEHSKPKRRWLRYSLRTFVVVLTVFCVWLGLLAYRVNKQREAVQWVRDQGGIVYYDFQLNDNGNEIEDAQPPGPDWLCEQIGIDYFADVVFVDFSGTETEGLEPLRDLTQLQGLNLDGTLVSDLSPLRELTQLQWLLLLDGTQVSNLSPLCGLTQLQVLSLTGTQVSDLKPLRDLTRLQAIWLDDTQVTDLEPLVKMKNVTILLDKKQQVKIPEELKDRVRRYAFR